MPLKKPLTKRGSLIVVGTGIMSVAHCSIESKTAIAAADKVYTLLPDPIGMRWLASLNKHIEPLDNLYQTQANRLATYVAMVATLVDAVRAGQQVCAVFYGHPGVFVYPSHQAIAQLRAEGFSARMLPGISAEDCLFADLGVDPAHPGCQSHEATAFLLWPRLFDPACALILWQIGVVGDLALTQSTPSPKALRLLVDKLLAVYPNDHRVAIYEAAQWPTAQPRIDWLPLAKLCRANFSKFSTLYVPPYGESSADEGVMKALGIGPEQW